VKVSIQAVLQSLVHHETMAHFQGISPHVNPYEGNKSS